MQSQGTTQRVSSWPWVRTRHHVHMHAHAISGARREARLLTRSAAILVPELTSPPGVGGRSTMEVAACTDVHHSFKLFVCFTFSPSPPPIHPRSHLHLPIPSPPLLSSCHPLWWGRKYLLASDPSAVTGRRQTPLVDLRHRLCCGRDTGGMQVFCMKLGRQGCGSCYISLSKEV